ncbi:MAG: TRAP transporter large permease [Pseudomonadota bacterium]
MNELFIGIIGFCLLLGLILLGVPIAFSGALVGILGLLTIGGVDITFYYLSTIPYSEVASYAYTTLPLYILMGEFAFFGGFAHSAYKTGRDWLGHLPGGMSIATIIGGAGFGAVCGASVVSSAVLGKICIPEMRNLGYDKSIAAASVAACANLASMIPPSGLMIVYSIFTEQSLGKLFMAGILPGGLLACLFAAMIFIRGHLNPSLAPPSEAVPWADRILSLRHAWGILLIAGVVLGGIYSGAMTVTEAGGAGAFTAFILVLIKRSLSWGNLKTIMLNSLRTTIMIFFIIVGIMIFTHFLTLTRFPMIVSSFLTGLPVNRLVILLLVLMFFLFLGMFFDAISMIALTIPVLYPTIMELGFDPIWFGVMTVLMCEIGLITPPVGINCYVVAGVAPDIPLQAVFKGVFPFVIINLIVAAILIIFPGIALFLPGLMSQ